MPRRAEWSVSTDCAERMYVPVTEEDDRGRYLGELEITACPGCAALVPADDVDRHVRWHRSREDHTPNSRSTPPPEGPGVA